MSVSTWGHTRFVYRVEEMEGKGNGDGDSAQGHVLAIDRRLPFIFNKSSPPLPAPSRYLANKCSIASRIDSFIEEPTNAYGEQLRDQVEGKFLVVVIFACLSAFDSPNPNPNSIERLRFYDTGETPRKNVDVMSAVASRLRGEESGTAGGSSKKSKKDKKESKSEKKVWSA